MGRAPCCAKVGLHRGPWTPREDELLVNYIQAHGEGHWRSLPKHAGLLRCGKSCRLRWMNYLRPDIKRGNITPDEEDLIIRLHSLLGNRWSLIAGRIPGRTDNEIKNYWNTHLKKRLITQGTDPNTHHKSSEPPHAPHPQQASARKKRKTAPKPSQDKNKKQNSTNKKDNSNKKRNALESIQKHKVHLPKAIRVTTSTTVPRNDSFESTMVDAGDWTSDVKMVPPAAADWFNENTAFVLDIQQHDEDMLNGSSTSNNDSSNGNDLECQQWEDAAANAEHDNLGKLYEEYLQLLRTEADAVQLDSFAESLFIV